MAFKTIEIVDAECVSASGCASAASLVQVDQTSQQTQTQIQTNQNQAQNYSGFIVGPTHITQAEFGPVAQDETLYNFVAGDKSSCEYSIQSRLGLVHTCTIGGGCGQYCGMPSSSCQSANPSLYGACIAY